MSQTGTGNLPPIRRTLLIATLAVLVVAAVQSSQATAATVPGSAEQVVTLDLKPRNAALLQQLAAAVERAGAAQQRAARGAVLSDRGPGRDGARRRWRRRDSGWSPGTGSRCGSRARRRPPSARSGSRRHRGGRRRRWPGWCPTSRDSRARRRSSPRPVAGPRTVTPSCSGAQDLHDTAGGYLPAQLASPAGYDHDALINAGYDGGGERIAFVEFSNYLPSDIAAYQSCFGLSVPITDVPVAGGNAQRNSALEVSLDVETAISAAPGLDHAYVYIAPPTTSMASVLDQIVAEQPSTGVHVVSVSWGLCETLMTPSRVAATNNALQLAAVAGMSVLVGSGDQGSLDCGLPPLSVDDPGLPAVRNRRRRHLAVPRPHRPAARGGLERPVRRRRRWYFEVLGEADLADRPGRHQQLLERRPLPPIGRASAARCRTSR